jgi:hypothetical protein
MDRGFAGEPAWISEMIAARQRLRNIALIAARNGDALQGIRTGEVSRGQDDCCLFPTACVLIVALLCCVENKTELENLMTESSRRIVAIVSSQTTASQAPPACGTTRRHGDKAMGRWGDAETRRRGEDSRKPSLSPHLRAIAPHRPTAPSPCRPIALLA